MHSPGCALGRRIAASRPPVTPRIGHKKSPPAMGVRGWAGGCVGCCVGGWVVQVRLHSPTCTPSAMRRQLLVSPSGLKHQGDDFHSLSRRRTTNQRCCDASPWKRQGLSPHHLQKKSYVHGWDRVVVHKVDKRLREAARDADKRGSCAWRAQPLVRGCCALRNAFAIP